MEVSGEAADLVMKEGVQISEEAIKLLARGAKNLAALLYALAKDQKKLYGKVNMKQRCTRGYKRYKETSGLIEWKECQIFHSIFT